MLDIAELKMDATLWSIRSISIQDNYLCFAYTDARRITQLAEKHGNQLRVVDREQAFWPLWTPKPLSEPKPTYPYHKPPSSRKEPVTKEPDLTDAERLAKIDLLATLQQILRW